LTRVIETFRTALTPRPGPAPALPTLAVVLVALLGALASGGCDTPLDDLNMMNTPRHTPGQQSEFFADGRADRDQVPGTVAQGQLMTPQNHLLRTGMDGDKESAVYPFEITRADLERGKQRFEIYCAVCHNANGDGKGMIVQRGFVPPPSYHEQRLKDAPPGHFFRVISNGWGAMYSYNDRIPVEDRWRIAAYVKVLQLSQNADVASLPPEAQEAIRNAEKKTTEQAAPAGKAAGHE
jgi:mono/diheme cytochrome c family protein